MHPNQIMEFEEPEIKPTKTEILILRALKLILEWQYWGNHGLTAMERIREYEEILKEIDKLMKPKDKLYPDLAERCWNCGESDWNDSGYCRNCGEHWRGK